ncbi:MAG: DUF3306 domain-containing protein [Pseudomonadota bacterium]
MSDDGFLTRWSKRKLEGPVEEPEPVEVVEAAAEPEVEKTDDEVLEELGLPDPEELKPGDDFSGFMAKAVPERLRNRALRKLWLTNPVLANLDELVDYGDDFTDAATVIENLQTVYQVGKGMLVEEDPPSEDEAEDAEDEAVEEPFDEMAEEPEDVLADAEDAAHFRSAEEAGDVLQPAPRRMKFQFDQS